MYIYISMYTHAMSISRSRSQASVFGLQALGFVLRVEGLGFGVFGLVGAVLFC